MKKSLLLVALIASLFQVETAYADVEVAPDPGLPQVILDGYSHQPSQPAPAPNSGGQVSDPDSDPWVPIIACREDPETGIYGCGNDQDVPPGEDPAPPTPGQILQATRSIGLPSLAIKLQPADQTLVNVPTVLYTEPHPFRRSVTLLGYDIDLAAEPVSYRWEHGDGSSQETSSPGSPYPKMDVTHRFERPAKDVRPRVDVTYQVRYRIDDGSWQTIDQTLTATGPAGELDVSEAAPVLTKP